MLQQKNITATDIAQGRQKIFAQVRESSSVEKSADKTLLAQLKQTSDKPINKTTGYDFVGIAG